MSERIDVRALEVQLDPIERLRVLARALPGSGMREATIDAPFDAVWRAATDIEGVIPQVEPFVRRAQIVRRDDERVQAIVKSPLLPAMQMEVLVRPGWCVMQTRMGMAAWAARPEGDRTRLAHLEAFRFPGKRLLGPLLRLKMRLVRELHGVERAAQTLE